MGYTYVDGTPPYGNDVVLFPVDGSTPTGLFDLGWTSHSSDRVDVSPSGEYAVFSDAFNETTAYPLDGGEPFDPIPLGFNGVSGAVWEDDGYLYFTDGGIWRFKPEL